MIQEESGGDTSRSPSVIAGYSFGRLYEYNYCMTTEPPLMSRTKRYLLAQ
jgi:hypothetical protein